MIRLKLRYDINREAAKKKKIYKKKSALLSGKINK